MLPADTPPGLPADTAAPAGKALSVSRHCNACRVCFLGIAARKQAVHLIRHGRRGAAQFRCQGNMFPLPGFFIKRFPLPALRTPAFLPAPWPVRRAANDRHRLPCCGHAYIPRAWAATGRGGPCNDTPFGSL